MAEPIKTLWIQIRKLHVRLVLTSVLISSESHKNMRQALVHFRLQD